MKKLFVLFPVLMFFIFSCSNQKGAAEKLSAEKYNALLKQGEQLANQAQAVLLQNVGKAMKKGGPEYAVEFCNLKASSLIDSLNKTNNVLISRVSAKNRNPENNLKNEPEKQLWDYLAQQANEGNAHDTVLVSNQKMVYYKPIKIAMPACLNCHGTPGGDISPATLAKLQTLYPDDKATGYHLNDFRGLWKIRFEE